MAKKTKTPPKPSQSTFARLRPTRWWHWLLAVLGLLMLLTLTARWWNPVVFPPVKDPLIGVSFSEKRAKELGLDWKANFTALLDDMRIPSFRLMSYWDLHEPVRGQYDFSTLDWQISEAAKRGATVSLALGQRQPRWPECHQPSWTNDLSGEAWRQALYEYVEVVVKRYENNPTVINWQLENEAVNEWFGLCGKPDRDRIHEEYKLVDRLSDKPIWMSLSDQHGLPFFTPVPDKYGYSVYRVVWSEKTWPYKGYLIYPTPIWYHKLRGAIISAYTGRDIYIHELQLEPWGPTDTKDMTIEDQDISMSPKRIRDNVHFARMIGKSEIYTWGSEWWYWRMVNGDDSVWNNVKETFEDARR